MCNRNPQNHSNQANNNRVPCADELLAMAAGHWPEILSDAGMPGEFLETKEGVGCKCAMCGGTDRSFKGKDFLKLGAWFCRKCFNKTTDPRPGDGIASIRWLRGCDEFEAKRWLHNWLLGRGITSPKAATGIEPKQELAKKPVKAWDALQQIAGVHFKKHESEVASALGVSIESLRRLRVGWRAFVSFQDKVTKEWKSDCATVWPMMEAAGKMIGQSYRGTTTGLKRREKGSQNGLTFEPTILERKHVEQLYVSEGQTDCAAALTIGLEAVACPSVGGKAAHEMLLDLVKSIEPQEVVVVADNDADGGGEHSAIELAKMLSKITRAKVILPQGFKDLRAWLRDGGATREAVELAASEAPLITDGEAAELLPVVADGHAAEVPSLPGAWRKPDKIGRGELPVFPVEVLPEPLRSFVAEVAEATQTPLDLCGLLSLAFCSGAVMRYAVIEAGRDWREPVNLYVAILLDPANRKSAVFSECLRPVQKIERERLEASKPEIAKANSHRRRREKRMHVCEKLSAEKGDAEAAMEAEQLAMELETEAVPTEPKLICDDSTSEAAEKLLAEQGGRLIVAGAEGGLFDVLAGRYTNGSSSFDAFLKCHAGDDLRIDRVGGRKSISVDRPAMTMAYAVQPQVIEGMAENPVFRGRGLVGRFCYAIPKSLIGRRKIDPEPVKDETRRDYENLIRRLYEIFEKRSASDAPVVLKLATDAMSAFLAFREDVERRLGDGAELELMRDWGGKLCGLAARFAAIIHLVSNNRPEPWRDPVSLSTVRAAVDLANYAVPHAAAVIDLMTVESDEATADGEYLAQWIQSRELAEFTQAAAYQHGRARFTKDQTRLAKALELLAKHGWVRLRPDTEKDGPGRKPSPVYEVNPAVLPPSKKPQGEKDGSEPQNIQGVI